MKPTIREPHFPEILESIDCPVNSGSNTTDSLSDIYNRMTGMDQKEQNSAMIGFHFVGGLVESALNAAALGAVESQSYIHKREVFCEKIGECGNPPKYSRGFPFQYCPFGSYCTSGSLSFDPGRVQAI